MWAGGGREAQEGEGIYIYIYNQPCYRIHFVVQQKLTEYCKTVILQ